MSSLFSVPSTPATATRTSRSRYNSDTGSTHSQSYLHIDPSLNQTPTPTYTRVHTNSVSRSQQHQQQQQQKTPRGSIVDHSGSPNPLVDSPVHESYSSRTLFAQHAEPPSPADNHDHERQQGSPLPQMPAYHPSPSPTATYGINGGLIVSSNPSTMATGNGSECQPLMPTQSDVFMNGKPGRPVLRPTLSHNSVLTPASTNLNRRLAGGYEDNSRSTTTESGIGYASTQQGSSAHEASAPYSHPSQSVATHHHSAYPPPPPAPSSAHHSSAHTQSMSINPGPQYSDPDLSFQSASYAGSYDSSYGSHSPWTPGSASVEHQYNHPYYAMALNRVDEPILAPGEVPAPRPPISYAALIGEALLLAPPPHQLYVSEISDSIKSRYVYYRQNPTKVYNGVRHQTSMCKAFVKLPRPYGDQSGGARKWGIRAGCETQFQGGGYKPAASRSVKQSASPPPGGKAKATARAKQLAIGTNPYHSHSPKMSHKVKQEPYVPYGGGNGPSVGPAYDGSSRASYPSPYAPSYYQAPGSATGYPPPGYHYLPMHPHAHPMQGWPHQQPQHQFAHHQGPGSPDHSDTSPQMTPAGPGQYGPPYPSHSYLQPGPGPYWQSAPPMNDIKPYGGMPPPSASTHHGYPQQQDDRPRSQQDQHSPASYDGQTSPHGRHRDNSAESPAQ